jgi:hypothetical protein
VTLALGQATGDLIEQQQPRAGGKRSRHLQPLALEQGQGPGRHIGAGDEPGLLEDAGADIGGVADRPAAAVHGGHQQVLEHGEVLEGERDLVGAADAGCAAPVRLRDA